MRRSEDWDVVIVGAGPAGLSAALVLGRARRRVLICDKGTPRNWASRQMHGFITRDGIDPREFRALAHEELARYDQVERRSATVVGVRPLAGGLGFKVKFARGSEVRSRKLLLATGVLDRLPQVPGIEKLFGTSVFQCPYCHGWEFRDRAVAVYGHGKRGFEMARAMTAWTADIVLCTDGERLTAGAQRQLQRNGIQVRTAAISKLEARSGRLKRIVFHDGDALAREALFFDTPSSEQSALSRVIGCDYGDDGGVKCGQYSSTSVPGVYAAGNITRDVQLAIVAAAEGTRAAFGINRALTREDFATRLRSPAASTRESASRPGAGRKR
ncbi:NAD(P)/FAD-dependent oxidoreductase [Peristeroidobacter agariperforans]|uniref:NAD(P)/FAD-dependent oxidoreductase n=1 Tax=Peristeroidobacter agariperforans TaxID=268404 RepID=UPI00101C4C8C|nr:NAD(P)/FAD-dependent oxidoreductase [Peristeroidobacter agariperforans]